MSQGLETTGRLVYLLSGIQETENDHLEDLQDDVKRKLSSKIEKGESKNKI